MECLGGNGFIEDFPLARRYREQPVMAIWEGSGNVIALDVLRAMRREPDSVETFFHEVSLAAGAHPLLDAHIAATSKLASEIGGTDAAAAQSQARRLVESMALALQAALLLRHAPTAVSEAFVGARLGEDRRQEYGSLDRGADLTAILARH
jgi:putative acyl-CoA dehydrogenase